MQIGCKFPGVTEVTTLLFPLPANPDSHKIGTESETNRTKVGPHDCLRSLSGAGNHDAPRGAKGNLIIANASPAALTNYVVIIANAYGTYPLNLSNLKILNPGDYPTLWLPQMQTTAASPGTHKFGLNINCAGGQTVMVEACTNLTNPDWQPVQTNALTTGTAYFSDPLWTNYPNRFYRLRSQ